MNSMLNCLLSAPLKFALWPGLSASVLEHHVPKMTPPKLRPVAPSRHHSCQRNRRRSVKYLWTYFVYRLPPISASLLSYISSLFLPLILLPLHCHHGINYSSWFPLHQGHPYVCRGRRRIWRGLPQCQRRPLVSPMLPKRDCC
jgi:hypothetical protein